LAKAEVLAEVKREVVQKMLLADRFTVQEIASYILVSEEFVQRIKDAEN